MCSPLSPLSLLLFSCCFTRFDVSKRLQSMETLLCRLRLRNALRLPLPLAKPDVRHVLRGRYRPNRLAFIRLSFVDEFSVRLSVFAFSACLRRRQITRSFKCAQQRTRRGIRADFTRSQCSVHSSFGSCRYVVVVIGSM